MKAHREACEVCGHRYDWLEEPLPGTENVFACYDEAIEHLLPRRWCEENGINPNDSRNLLSCCTGCHGKATRIEDRLWHGDLVGFLTEMRAARFPVERIVSFAVAVGLEEFAKVAV